jgi:hypothetical protein
VEELSDDILMGYYDLWLYRMDLGIQGCRIKVRPTAFGNPVVPLLKHSTAHTSLFIFPVGKLHG